MRKTIFATVILAIAGWAGSGWAWDANEVKKLEPNVATTIANLKERDPSVQSLFDKSAGYAIFPSVAKGGLGPFLFDALEGLDCARVIRTEPCPPPSFSFVFSRCPTTSATPGSVSR